MARYLVGIDLGTTNSALAYIDLDHPPRPDGRVDIRSFPVPQLVAPGEVKERPLLPSFLYLPGPHDQAAGATALPWDKTRDYAVGEFARNHGGRVPGRLVTSAKSWLCHAGVDRTAPLLPWTAPPDVARLSPVEASTRYLRHMVEGWNYVMAQGRDDIAFRNTFSPEFRNRLDARISFDPLSPATMTRVVDKFIVELGKQLAERDVSIELSTSAKAYLAEKGYDKQNGARPLARLIQDEVKKPLGDELLFGALESGGHVHVDVEGEKLSFTYEAKSDPGPKLLN